MDGRVPSWIRSIDCPPSDPSSPAILKSQASPATTGAGSREKDRVLIVSQDLRRGYVLRSTTCVEFATKQRPRPICKSRSGCIPVYDQTATRYARETMAILATIEG